jgi:hypothetical protein
MANDWELELRMAAAAGNTDGRIASSRNNSASGDCDRMDRFTTPIDYALAAKNTRDCEHSASPQRYVQCPCPTTHAIS